MVDNRVGLMIYVVSGNMQGRSWSTAFIVFRGSRGSSVGTGENPMGAGWDQSSGEAHNLDWGANFNNAQVPAPWRTSCKVHRGFLEIYSSIGQLIRNDVEKLKTTHPNLQVVCTGHSLGAALATLCAHDLESSTPIRPFCYPFCAPKVGNLAFVRDFDLNIASKLEPLACEPGNDLFSRAITFVQGNDPVSWGGEHGFAPSKKSYKHSSEKHGYDHLRSEGQRLADSGSTVKQAIWAMGNRSSKTAIYYLAPNVHRASRTGLHSYLRMEAELLGKRGG